MTDNTTDARPTTATLKADIDAGRTGDKVNNADPGLSPLGTDDEAAGNPVSVERLRLAETIEKQQGVAAGPPVRDTRRPGPSIWIMAAVVVAVAVAVILFVTMH
jgi:hypothetical protein